MYEFTHYQVKDVMTSEAITVDKQVTMSDVEAIFRKVYGKKDASPYEFDIVINCDYIREPQWAAEIVAQSFNKKFDFGTENR